MSFMTDMFIMTGKGTPEDSVDKYKRDNRGKDLDKEWTYQEVWDELFNSGNVLPQPLTKAHRVVVVDADDVAYRIAAACDKRSVVATVRGEKLEFDNKTKLKKFCEDVYFDFDTLEYENKVVSEDISFCLNTVKHTIKNMYRDINATHVIFFLGGSDNFRLKLPLPIKYKSNRKSSRKTTHLKAIREYLNKYYQTYVIKDVEADDCCVGITQHIINNTDAYAISYQRDKDFLQALTKNRYYHSVTGEITELSGGLGKLYLEGNNVKGQGLSWLLLQTMLGDATDGYSPKQFFNVRYADKSYYKQFKDYDNEKDLLLAWVEQWKTLLPEVIEYTTWEGVEVKCDWLELANLFFKPPYMMMHPNDTTTFSDILERYHLGYLVGRGGYRDGMKQGDICEKIGDSYLVLL